MASHKGKRTRKKARQATKPTQATQPKSAEAAFNAPFAGLGAEMGKRRTREPRLPEQPPRVAEPAPPGPPAAAPLSEAESFAEATMGVQPIKRGRGRVVRRHVADFASIAAGRDSDLAALEAAAGFDVSYSDNFVRGRTDGVSRETLAKLERGEFAVKAHIDLHGMAFEDARAAVDEFIRTSQRRGHRCVLLITGKGRNSPGQEGVLRKGVPDWLARGPSARRVLAFVSARECDGGNGALAVLLRKTSSRKNHIDVEVGGVGGLSG